MARNFNPKYKINLIDVFNRAYSGRSQEFRDALRPSLSSFGLKRLYGQSVINEIQERTLDGKDKRGLPMGGYSKEYRESLEFKIFKGGQTKVNLRLTGDMLSDIRPSDTAFTIVFGLGDQNNRNKAQGHISGKYGKAGRTRPRDFLGLPKSVEESLLREILKITRRADLDVIAELFEAAAAKLAQEVATGEQDGG